MPDKDKIFKRYFQKFSKAGKLIEQKEQEDAGFVEMRIRTPVTLRALVSQVSSAAACMQVSIRAPRELRVVLQCRPQLCDCLRCGEISKSVSPGV